MAVEATEIYSGDFKEYFDSETLDLLSKGINPIKFPGLTLSVTSDDSMAINIDKAPKVILSASGMCEAGRIRHHLKHNLWRSECTVLFVGYQAHGTLGRTILEGAKMVRIFGEEIEINARIVKLDGVSGHADKDMLLEWLRNFDGMPKTVFVNHGEDRVCDEFAATIEDELGISAVAPYNAAEYDLITGVCLEKGNTHRISDQQVPEKGHKESAAFKRLVSA